MAKKRIRRETPPPITTATTTTTTTIQNIPTDLLRLILKRLDQESLRSIKLAFPLFISLTDAFITELTFSRILEDKRIQRLLNRFPFVKEIDLKSTNIERALIAISKSTLNIESVGIYGTSIYPRNLTIFELRSSPGQLKYVKKLKVEWVGNNIGLRRMVMLIEIFKGMDELELISGGRWDDAGIRFLTQKVPNLRTIKIGENKLLSNRALISLKGSCLDLQHIFLEGCSRMTPEGLCEFIFIFPNLRTLHLPVFSRLFTQDVLIQLGNSIGGLKYLTQLKICGQLVNDDVLKAIGRFELPLTRLEVEKVGTIGLYTMKGLGDLLSASISLTILKVSLPELDFGNQDWEMSQLVKLLTHLKCIQIQMRHWFHETLFSLIENCHKLETITINGDNAKCGSDIHIIPPKKKNFSVESICIKPRLEDSLRTTLQSSCPCLKWLKSG